MHWHLLANIIAGQARSLCIYDEIVQLSSLVNGTLKVVVNINISALSYGRTRLI